MDSKHQLNEDFEAQLEYANNLFDENRTSARTIQAYENCVSIARNIGHSKLLAQPLYKLGKIYGYKYDGNQSTNDIKKARKYFDEALQVAEQNNMSDLKALALVELGQISYFLGEDWKLFYQNCIKAASIAKEIKNEKILEYAEDFIHIFREEHPLECQQLEKEINDEYLISENFQEATLVVSGSDKNTKSFHDSLITGELAETGIFDARFVRPEKYSPVQGIGKIKSGSTYKYQIKYSGEMPVDKLSRLSGLFPELIMEFTTEETEKNFSATWANGEMMKSGSTYNPIDEGPASVKTADSGDDSEGEFLSSIDRRDESIDVKLNQTLDYVTGLFNQDNPQKAKNILEELIEEYQAEGSKKDLNLARTMLATAHRLIIEEYYPDYNRDYNSDDYFVEANNALKQAELYFSQKNEIDSLLNVYTEQAGLFIATNQLEKALKILTKNNEIALRTARFHHLQFGLGQLGEILEKQQKPEEALKAYKRQMLVAKRHNNVDGLAEALYNIGWLYKRANDFTNARKYLIEALPVSKTAGLHAMKSDIESIIGEIDREPRQNPPAGGSCLGSISILLLIILLLLLA